MSLTKRERKELETIKANIQRAVNYLKRAEIVGIAEKTNSPLGCDYTIRNSAAIETCVGLTEHVRTMNKFAGSDIAGLYTALQQIEHFLNPPMSTLPESA